MKGIITLEAGMVVQDQDIYTSIINSVLPNDNMSSIMNNLFYQLNQIIINSSLSIQFHSIIGDIRFIFFAKKGCVLRFYRDIMKSLNQELNNNDEYYGASL